ncbi:MAG: peptide deformylase [Candidatus Woesebacteria bacterium]
MAIKPILTVPHEILRKKSVEVVFDKKIREISKELADTLFAKGNPKGVGLSAPQIGKSKRLFVTWLASDPEDEPVPEDLQVFINPTYIEHSSEVTFGPDKDDPILEGCLSIPNFYGPVPRFEWVDIAYESVDKDGELISKTGRFAGFSARVIQHEFDHLEGILFTDYSLKYDLPVYEFIGKKMKEINKELVKAF